MDISKLLTSNQEEEEEGGWLGETHNRDILYKRRGINFSGNTKENRALRHIREKERRKSCRLIQHTVGRNITEDDEAGDTIAEDNHASPVNIIPIKINKTNGNWNKGLVVDQLKQRTVFPPVTPNTRKALSKSRREKLAEYLEEKKKLEELKRRQAKPAFKMGTVRHGPAPFGSNLSNNFSVTNNSTMNSTKMSMSRCYNTSRAGPIMSMLKGSTRNLTKGSNIETTKPTVKKSKPTLKIKPPTIRIDPPLEENVCSTSSEPTTPISPVSVPATSIIPVLSKPAVSDVAPSTPALPSFAPLNFQFQLNLPVSCENQVQSTPKQEKMKSILPLPKLSNIVAVEEVEKMSASKVDDDVFDEAVSFTNEESTGNTENTTEIDIEILKSVHKNEIAKTLERKNKLDNAVFTSSLDEIAPFRLGPATPARMKMNRQEEMPSTDEVDAEDCKLSPIKLKFPTSQLNIQSSSFNNNSDMKLAPEVLNKSFSSIDTHIYNTVFKTPVRPASRSTRGSISENRPRNPNSFLVGEIDDSLKIVPSFVRSIKSVEDLSISELPENPVELNKINKQVVTNYGKVAPTLQSNQEVSDSEFGVAYFREVLGGEYRRLTNLCEVWDKRLQSDRNLMSEDILGELLSVIGQGKLIMSERFSQFSGLVDNCEYKLGEKETKTSDLRGFWDMIYNQVVDVDKKFARLSVLYLSAWIEEVTVRVEKKLPRKKLASSSRKTRTMIKSSSGLADMIAARRREMSAKGNASTTAGVEKLVEDESVGNGKRMNVKEMIAGVEKLVDECKDSVGSVKRLNVKEMIAKKRAQLAEERCVVSPNVSVKIIAEESSRTCASSPDRIFEGGFFSIKSPKPHNTSLDVRSVSKIRSIDKSLCSGDGLRRSVLHSGRRMSGLVSPYLSQVARRAVTRRSFIFDDTEDANSTPPPLDNKYLAPATPSTPLTNTTSTGLTWSSSSEEPDERKGVRFTPGEELASPTTGTVLGTPHTKSGKKLTYERMEDSSNSSPGLRKARGSLLPFVSSIDVAAEDNLIMLCSPARNVTADIDVQAHDKLIL